MVEEPKPIQPQQQKKDQKENSPFLWTVMVYMVADAGPSFYRAAMEDITEMTKATFDHKKVKVVVHADAPSPWLPKCWEVKSDDAKQMEAACEHESLLDFVAKCVSNPAYKAEHYLLVLWGHGEGIDWKEKAVTNRPTRPPTSGAVKRFAQGSQGAMELAQLGQALKGLKLEVKPKDVVVGFDACLMSMVEVYCEISERVGWGVAANDEIPDTGWPYQKILNKLGEDPAIEPESLAKTIAEECARYYSKQSPENYVSFSACNLDEGDKLKLSVRSLTSALKRYLKSDPSLTLNAIKAARDFGEDFGEKAYVDLNAFCVELGRFKTPKTDKPVPVGLKNAAEAVVKALRKFLVEDGYFFSDEYPQKYTKESLAVSICFPESVVLEIDQKLYEALKFSEESQWPGFLENLLDRASWAKLRDEPQEEDE